MSVYCQLMTLLPEFIENVKIAPFTAPIYISNLHQHSSISLLLLKTEKENITEKVMFLLMCGINTSLFRESKFIPTFCRSGKLILSAPSPHFFNILLFIALPSAYKHVHRPSIYEYEICIYI